MAISFHRPNPIRRAALLVVVASVAAFGGVITTVRPVAACSCAMPGSMKENATAEQAIFTGTAGSLDARGVPVKIDRWLWGRNAAPVVWLAASSFGDSAGCGTNPPLEGSQWLWVAWLPGNDGDFGTGLCSPSGDLGTPEGQAMLKEALAVFGQVGVPVATEAPTLDAILPVTTGPDPTPDAAAAARDRAAVTIIGGLFVGSLLLFGAVLLVGRLLARRSDDPGRGT
jgi:hypothetical protein